MMDAMDKLSFVQEKSPYPIFNILINGKTVAELIGEDEGEVCGLPDWIIEKELPTWDEEDHPGEKIVAVCTCLESGCWHVRCRVIKEQARVVFDNFTQGNASGRNDPYPPMRFEFAPENYGAVCAEIYAITEKYRRKSRAAHAREMKYIVPLRKFRNKIIELFKKAA